MSIGLLKSHDTPGSNVSLWTCTREEMIKFLLPWRMEDERNSLHGLDFTSERKIVPAQDLVAGHQKLQDFTFFGSVFLN